MSVTIEFHGICTFVSKDTVPELPTPWRAVLLNASRPTEIRGIPIAAHIASIEITLPDEKEPSRTLLLRGYRMFLSAQVSVPLLLGTDFFRLPNLTDLMRQVEPITAPNPQVVLHGDPEKAAAFFDLDMGKVTAGLSTLLAATTVLTIDVPVTLHIQSFEGITPPFQAAIDLPLGSRVKIANADDKAHEGALGVDFLLHYLSATSLPFVPQVPQNVSLPLLPHTYQTVGAGCSNSTYP